MSAGTCLVASPLLGVILACSGEPPAIGGFEQTLATTKCGFGGSVKEVENPTNTEWIGPQGYFTIDKANQSAHCATAPFQPLMGPSQTVEATLVQAYFEGAGLPSSQVATPFGFSYYLDSSGEEYVTAILHRTVGGYPVPESHAWASLVDGQSVGEDVYWPALPGTVTQEIDELSAILASPSKLAAYQSMLPEGLITGAIVVHHTCEVATVAGDPGAAITLVAHACYDAVIANSGGLGSTASYLPDGTLFPYATGCSAM